MSTDNDRLFYLEPTAEISICGISGWVAQYPNIYIVENNMLMSYDMKKDYSIKNIDSLILHGMQLSFLYNDIATQMTKLYQVVQYQKCLSDYKIISTTLSLARLDPNSLGLSIFGNPGFLQDLQVRSLTFCNALRKK